MSERVSRYLGEGAAAAASAAKSVAPAAAGPVVINLLGHNVPVLSAIVGIAGVVLARILARRSEAEQMALGYELALIGLLCLVIVTAVIGAQTGPLITIGWAIGLGWSGVTVIQAIGRRGSINPANPAIAEPEKQDPSK